MLGFLGRVGLHFYSTTSLWTPALLFAAGEPGVWYDPSDFLPNWRLNLLTQTENFSSADWASYNVSKAAGSLTLTGTSGGAYQLKTLTSDVPYRFECQIKKGTNNFAYLNIQGSSVYATAVFDVNSGVPGETKFSGAGFAVASLSVSGPDADGYYTCGATFTPGTASVAIVGFAAAATGNTFDAFGNPTGCTNGNTLLVRKADFRLASNASVSPTYQKITDGIQDYFTYQPQPVMFTDAAGTTPVTAVEQPVGLLLDKSKGLALGSELVTNGDFSNGATGWGLTNVTVSGGVATITGAPTITQSMTLVSGVTYRVSLTVSGLTGGSLWLRFIGGTAANSGLFNNGVQTFFLRSNGNTTLLIEQASGAITAGTIDDISVKALPGNHASQSTAASRPVLSARVNLLTYTEQFDNAAWTKNGLVTAGMANVATAPDGTQTADQLVETAASGTHIAYVNVSGTKADTISVAAKAITGFGAIRYLTVACHDGGGANWTAAAFNLSAPGTAATAQAGGTFSGTSSITPLGNGWYRCTLSVASSGSAVAQVKYGVSNSATPTFGAFGDYSYTGDGTSGIYIWGADLRATNVGVNLPAYQRVGAATYGTPTVAGNPDYDTTGFPLFLAFGSRWMVSSTITPGTNKAQVFAGVRKLSDAAAGILVEFSTSAANNGSFGLQAPNSSTNSYRYETRGTTGPSIDAMGYASPITNVLTGLSDISAPNALLRINGAQSASSSVSQGTGDYLAYPLYLGARAGTNLYYNGNLYELIVRFGPNLSEATIDQTEVWVGDKTGLNLSYATQQTIFDRFNATVLNRPSDIILQRY